MNYWWVNQNQTYQQESQGGYMWSPKKSKSGARVEYYDNMTRVVPGDIVFSYRGGQLVSTGIIQSEGYASPKPSDFGHAGEAWSNDGWRVDVEYHETTAPIRPKDHIATIRELLPAKYSPLQANGNGNQVYLCSISDQLGGHLIDLIGEEALQIVQGLDVDYLESESADAEEESIRQDDSLRDTDKRQLVRSRRGQGLFRSRLENIEKSCRVTGVSKRNHLIASHIKPWAESSNIEKLDGSNGLLLAPHVDHLFDKGYISFQDDGSLIVSPQLAPSVLADWGVQAKINVGGFTSKQRFYLAYHRDNRLKK